MKNKAVSKTIYSAALMCAAFFCAVTLEQSASAVQGKECKVNDVTLSVGDVFTYTLNLSYSKDDFSGIDFSLYYDPDVLSLDAEKISLPVFENAIFNPDLSGEIRFNAIDVTKGYDFKKENTVISADFKILDSSKSSTNITFSIKELYDMNTESVTDYKTKVIIKKGGQTAGEIVKPKDIETIEKMLETQYSDISGGDFPTVWVIVAGIIVGGAAAVAVVALLQKRKKRREFDDKVTKN